MARGLIAVDQGHGHVHDHHIRAQLAGQVDHLAAVGRRADHLDAGHLGQQRRQALPHDLVIVRQQDAQDRAGRRRTEDGRRTSEASAVLRPRSSVLCFLSVGDDDMERAALALGALDLHASAEQLDALADTEQAEPGGLPQLLRVEPTPVVGDRQADTPPHAPQPNPGLVDPGVLDHVEQQFLGRFVQEGFERIRPHGHLVDGIHMDDQAVLLLDLPRQPVESFYQVPVVQHRRTELVRQAAGFLNRVLEHVIDLGDNCLFRRVAPDPVAQHLQVELRRGQLLLQIIVQDLR